MSEPEKIDIRAAAIGYRLRRLRKDRDLLQEQVAEAVGYSRNRISDVELGKAAPMALLERLASFYGVSLDFLLNGTERPVESDLTESAPTKPEDFGHFVILNIWDTLDNPRKKKLIECGNALLDEMAGRGG